MENITLYMTRNLKDIDRLSFTAWVSTFALLKMAMKSTGQISRLKRTNFPDQTRALDHFNKRISAQY